MPADDRFEEGEKDRCTYRALALRTTGKKKKKKKSALLVPEELVAEPPGRRHLRWRADAAVAGGLLPRRRGGTAGAWGGKLTQGTDGPSAAKGNWD